MTRTDGSHDGDGTVTYDRSGFVFWMLWNLMGADRNFAGLQQFIADHRNNPDHAVLADFEQHMRRYAPDTVAYDQFVRQWMDSTVVPEYQLTAGHTVRTAAGWETTVHVENVGTGRMPIDVAAVVGERALDSTAKAKVPYQAASVTVVLDGKEGKDVTVVSAFKPERVVIDPDVKVLQLRREAAQLKL